MVSKQISDYQIRILFGRHLFAALCELKIGSVIGPRAKGELTQGVFRPCDMLGAMDRQPYNYFMTFF